MLVPPLPTFTGMLTILPGVPLFVPLVVPLAVPFGVLLVAGSVTILPMPLVCLVLWLAAGSVTILPGVCDGVRCGWLLPAGRLTVWPPLPSLPMPLLSP